MSNTPTKNLWTVDELLLMKDEQLRSAAVGLLTHLEGARSYIAELESEKKGFQLSKAAVTTRAEEAEQELRDLKPEYERLREKEWELNKDLDKLTEQQYRENNFGVQISAWKELALHCKEIALCMATGKSQRATIVDTKNLEEF